MPTASCSSCRRLRTSPMICFVEWLDVDAEAGVGVGVAPRQVQHQRAQLILRGLARDARREPPDHEDHVRVADGREIAAERERARHAAIAAQPQIDVAKQRRVEACRHDADHGVAAGRRGSSVRPIASRDPPNARRQNPSLRTATSVASASVVFGQQRAADGGRGAERGEERARGAQRMHALGLAEAGQRRREVVERRQRLERRSCHAASRRSWPAPPIARRCRRASPTPSSADPDRDRAAGSGRRDGGR